jgi:hypothetical protein
MGCTWVAPPPTCPPSLKPRVNVPDIGRTPRLYSQHPSAHMPHCQANPAPPTCRTPPTPQPTPTLLLVPPPPPTFPARTQTHPAAHHPHSCCPPASFQPATADASQRPPTLPACHPGFHAPPGRGLAASHRDQPGPRCRAGTTRGCPKSLRPPPAWPLQRHPPRPRSPAPGPRPLDPGPWEATYGCACWDGCVAKPAPCWHVQPTRPT